MLSGTIIIVLLCVCTLYCFRIRKDIKASQITTITSAIIMMEIRLYPLRIYLYLIMIQDIPFLHLSDRQSY